MRLANIIENRMLFRLVDANAYSTFGIRPSAVPALQPGSWIDASTTNLCQLARYGDGDPSVVIEAIRRRHEAQASPLPAPVRVLRNDYSLSEIDGTADGLSATGDLAGDTWVLPIAVESATLSVASLTLAETEHGLIIGGADSGKSTALESIAETARRLDPNLTIVAIAHRRSNLSTSPSINYLCGRSTPVALVEQLIDRSRVLVLIDDADVIPPDLAELLTRIALANADERHLIAACRPDYPKSFDAWVQPLRRSQTGIALQPNPHDGDAFRTMLPLSRPERFPPGRGFLVTNGVSDMVQLAVPVDTNRIEHVEAAGVASASDHGADAARVDIGLGSFTTVPTETLSEQAAAWEFPATIDLGLADDDSAGESA